MSHNPMRAAKQGGRRVRQVNPHAGVKHSDIVKKRGAGSVLVVDATARQQTDTGWHIPAFEGDDFEVRYEYMCARSGSGIVKNEDQDRFIRVLSGILFVLNKDGYHELRAGQGFVCERGKEYELATSESLDAELMICQGSKYTEKLKVIRPAERTNKIPVSPGPAVSTPITPRRASSKAQMHAERIEASRADRRAKRTPVKREPKRAPLASQIETGVNPRPVGPEGFAED